MSQPWKPPFTSDKVKFSQSGQCNYQKVNEALPVGFRPIVQQQTVVFSEHTDSFALMFDLDGSCVALGNPSSEYACCSGTWVTADEWPS